MDPTTVLVPLDGSQTALAALPYAEAIARAAGTALHLVAVVDRKRSGIPGLDRETHGQLERGTREHLERYLAESAGAASERGVAATGSVLDGDPAEQIIAAAESGPAGMVVMTTHGHGRSARTGIGGVTDKVMRTLQRPLLLVQPPAAPEPHQPIAIRTIMVPLDGSDAATAALAPAVELAARTGATITLVRVEPFLSHWLTGFEAPLATGAAEENVTQAGIEYLEATRAQLPAELSIDTLLLRGGVDANLAEYAGHQGVDLVVMTTHGHGGLHDRMLGSTTDRLVRAGAPVLLIRPHSGDGQGG